MKNIELKIVFGNFKDVECLLKLSGARFIQKMSQKDTYYNCNNGRLKLREIDEKKFELISYSRPDDKNSKISNYKIIKIVKDLALDIKNILNDSLGEKVIVKKERKLWIYKNTRIHLDRVNNLGNFLELETVVKNIDINEAKKEHKNVIKILNIAKNKKISNSYSDMLINKKL